MRRGPPPPRTPFALHGLLPPADYTEPETLSPRRGAFGLLHDDESTSAVVGRVLGSGAEAEARWKHLAGDAAACEAIRGSVVLNHVCPHPDFTAIADANETVTVDRCEPWPRPT